MSEKPERVTDCHAELVLDTVECALPLGHDGPHRIGDLYWDGASVSEQNEALRAEVARLRETVGMMVNLIELGYPKSAARIGRDVLLSRKDEEADDE